MNWRPIVASVRVCGLMFVLALFSPAQSSSSPQTSTPSQAPEQAYDQTIGIPSFYTQSRQVLVEAEVWSKSHDKTEPSWAGDEPLKPFERGVVKHLPPPARGLNASEFRVFDNGVEQRVNYFKEADFPAVDNSYHWYLIPTVEGIWGMYLDAMAFEPPSATYVVGYVPPQSRPGECRTIKIAVAAHVVQANRTQYCVPSAPAMDERASLQTTKVGRQIRKLAESRTNGLIRVSVGTFNFWSSGVLHLAAETPETPSGSTISKTGYTYVVEVHDARAPASVHIAVGFDPPEKIWSDPCQENVSAVSVGGVVYKMNREIAGQFAGTLTCRPPTFAEQALPTTGMVVPSRFDTQIDLPPGDYELAVVVTDGNYFGRTRIPLHVEAFNPDTPMISDIVVGGIVRGAAWVIRDAASVSPFPVVPTPLVSRDIQFFPDSDTPPRLRKRMPLFLYFEIYRPLPEIQSSAVYYQLRVTNQKTGTMVMNTGPMNAAEWVVPGDEVIPIGLNLDTKKLPKGSYRVEVHASDSAGRQSEWRQANFNIQ